MKVHKLEELIHRTNSLMTPLLSFLMPLQKFYFYFCEMSYAVAVEKTICWLAHLLSIRLGSKCHCLLVGFGLQKRGLGNPTCTVIGTQKNRLLLASKFKLEHQNLSKPLCIVYLLKLLFSPLCITKKWVTVCELANCKICKTASPLL